MDTNDNDINIDANFLPATSAAKTSSAKGKKRAISEGEQMVVDDATGIEGTVRQAPRRKRKKQNSLELRKIPVPPHRFVVVLVVFLLWWKFEVFHLLVFGNKIFIHLKYVISLHNCKFIIDFLKLLIISVANI